MSFQQFVSVGIFVAMTIKVRVGVTSEHPLALHFWK